MGSLNSNIGDPDCRGSLVNKLLQLYEDDRRSSFPYTDCRKIVSGGGAVFDGLIPDLDLYFYEIASHCGGAAKILTWSKSRLLESRKKLERSFFEKHPAYKPLEPKIHKVDTPDLYQDIALHEEMRSSVLKLISLLLS